LLQEILKGYYSDPPTISFYTFILDANGDVKKDNYGLPLLKCSRGTGLTESFHRQMNTMFRHIMEIEAGDCALSERRHRHNVDVAGRNYSDYPKLGHYDTWDVDLLQELVERNTGKLLFPGWCNVNDFEDTDESFVTAPIHDQELQTCLEDRVEELRSRRGGFEPIYSRYILSLQCMGCHYSLPATNEKERIQMVQ
jgi:hypothetical protein